MAVKDPVALSTRGYTSTRRDPPPPGLMMVPAPCDAEAMTIALGSPLTFRGTRGILRGSADDGLLPVSAFRQMAVAIGASWLSRQLAELRGTGLVLARRDGNTVAYSLSAGEVTDLVRTARQVLTHVTRGQGRLLAELRLEHAL